MQCASGERPGGRTDGLTERNEDKCLETFNHNHECCHSTAVQAWNCISAGVGHGETRQLKSCLTLENRGEPLFLKVGVSRSIDKDDRILKTVGLQGLQLPHWWYIGMITRSANNRDEL